MSLHLIQVTSEATLGKLFSCSPRRHMEVNIIICWISVSQSLGIIQLYKNSEYFFSFIKWSALWVSIFITQFENIDDESANSGSRDHRTCLILLSDPQFWLLNRQVKKFSFSDKGHLPFKTSLSIFTLINLIVILCIKSLNYHVLHWCWKGGGLTLPYKVFTKNCCIFWYFWHLYILIYLWN